MLRRLICTDGGPRICFIWMLMLLETAGIDSILSGEVVRIGLVTSAAASYEAWDDVRSVAWAMDQRSDLRKARGIQRNVHLFCTEDTYVSDTSSAFLSPFQWTVYGLNGQISDDVYTQDVDGTDTVASKHALALRRIQIAQHGTLFQSWAVGMRMVVFVGVLPRRQLCSGTRFKCVFIPPQVHPYSPFGSGNQQEGAATVLAWGADVSLEVWARGPEEEAYLLRKRRPGGPRVVLIPWSIPDRVVREGKSVDSESTLQDEVGGPSASAPKLSVVLPLLGVAACDTLAVQLACAAVAKANALASEANGRQTRQTTLRVTSWKPTFEAAKSWIMEDLSCRELQTQGKLTHDTFSEPSELRVAWSVADVAVFPVGCICGWRGGSLSALHAGIPVLAPAAPPFNETATHMHDAILLRPDCDPTADTTLTDENPRGHTTRCWASTQQLADSLRQLHFNAPRDAGPRRRSLLRRLSAPQPGLLLARRSAFILHLHHRWLRQASDPPPTILSFWPGPHADHRRTELFRSDGFRRHGFAVRELTYSADLQRELSTVSPEFVVTAKPRVEFLKQLRRHTDAAVYVWTWDLIDFEDDVTRRAWFEEAMRHSTAAFLNEMGRELMWARLGGNVHFVNDGTVLIGNRGPSRRPTQHPPADSGGDVVFIGSIHAKDTPRIEALRAVIEAGIKVDIFGPEAQWGALNFSSAGQLWAEEAYAAEVRAKVVLAVSRNPPGIAMYRSDRLLRATGGGACIVTNAFPGIELMLSDSAVRWVPEDGGPAAVVSEVKAALADAEGRWVMRQRAEEVTWRRHTWEDSVGKMLFWVRRMHGGSGSAARFFCGGTSECGVEEPSDIDDEQGCESRAVAYYAWVAGALLADDEEQEARYYLMQGLRRCPSDWRMLLSAAVAAIRVGAVGEALRFGTTARRLGPEATAKLRRAWDRCHPHTEMAWFRQHVGGAVASKVERHCGLVSGQQQKGVPSWLDTAKEAVGWQCSTVVSLVALSNRLSAS